MTIVEFLNAQYVRLEKRAREMHDKTCQTDPDDKTDADGRPMEVVCHCDWHITGVLADIAAKRRILDEVVDEATSLDMSVDNDRRVGPRDMASEPYLGDILLRLLAAPFSGEPGYKEDWAV